MLEKKTRIPYLDSEELGFEYPGFWREKMTESTIFFADFLHKYVSKILVLLFIGMSYILDRGI
jgi:hypothetical protein